MLRNPTGILLGTLHLGAEAALQTYSTHTHALTYTDIVFWIVRRSTVISVHLLYTIYFCFWNVQQLPPILSRSGCQTSIVFVYRPKCVCRLKYRNLASNTVYLFFDQIFPDLNPNFYFFFKVFIELKFCWKTHLYFSNYRSWTKYGLCINTNNSCNILELTLEMFKLNTHPLSYYDLFVFSALGPVPSHPPFVFGTVTKMKRCRRLR